MGLQDDAARSFAAALGRLHFATTTAAAMTPWVKLTAHPEATVYFKVDHMGGLLVDFVFDGQPPERLNVAAGMDALAKYVARKVAGDGGSPASKTTS
jgi:hypothetical protein